MTGIIGVVFFILNALCTLVLLLIVVISSIYAVFSKKDTRYRPIRDDRASFTKGLASRSTELDELAAIARVEFPDRHGIQSTDRQEAR